MMENLNVIFNPVALRAAVLFAGTRPGPPGGESLTEVHCIVVIYVL